MFDVWINRCTFVKLGRSKFELSSAHEKFGVWTGPYSHSVSFHLGVEMGTGKFNAGSNPAMDQLPIQGPESRED